nr:DNA-directed RNA polymerase II complex subunit Rpb11 [Cryptomonas sp.]
MSNIPNSLESIVLSEKVQKIDFQKDKNILNCGHFKIQKEDHTIGILIQRQLLKEPNVIFSGYKRLHPLEHFIVLKIITNGKMSPVDALDVALKNLYIEFSILEDSLSQVNK